MKKYPNPGRNEIERESYDKYYAALKERERWRALSLRKKFAEVTPGFWYSLFQFFVAACVIYTVMHVLHISGKTSGEADGDPYEFTAGMGH